MITLILLIELKTQNTQHKEMTKATIVNDYSFYRVSASRIPKMPKIGQFLSEHGLGIDHDIEHLILAYDECHKIIACGGIAGNVLKSIAIADSLQGSGFSLKLMTELTNFAYELGRFSLFLFTKPENIKRFRQCGFHLIEKIGDKIAFMENSPNRLSGYCRKLSEQNVIGEKIGSIVMNANPFTKGHLYLVEQACEQCDWVHLFAVKEEGNAFPFADRLAMIRAGTAHFDNLTIHTGSEYILSRATFPSYFIKDQKIINYVHTALDLKIFRHYIGPALGITHRYVGSEPLCLVTQNYNNSMSQWLENEPDDSPVIEVIELDRRKHDAQPISASRVRKLLEDNNMPLIRALVPKTTYSFLCQHYLNSTLFMTQNKLSHASDAV